jgi:hypothetical protein
MALAIDQAGGDVVDILAPREHSAQVIVPVRVLAIDQAGRDVVDIVHHLAPLVHSVQVVVPVKVLGVLLHEGGKWDVSKSAVRREGRA